MIEASGLAAAASGAPEQADLSCEHSRYATAVKAHVRHPERLRGQSLVVWMSGGYATRAPRPDLHPHPSESRAEFPEKELTVE